LKTINDLPFLSLVIKTETHTWDWQLFSKGIYESCLSGVVPHDFPLELRLNLKNSLGLHPIEIRAGSKLVICDNVRRGDFGTILFLKSLIFKIV